MAALRIIFMGTAELSCASLETLAREENFHVAAVVTQPDKPKGRDLKLQPSPVKSLALKLNLPVLQPARARDEKFIGELRGLQPDLIVVVAYGHILPRTILDLPKFGCLNVHTSLLPKFRGAAPIQWAIANGETETGVTVMKMDAGLDTGPIVSQRRTPILPEDDSSTLHDRLARLGAELLRKPFPILSPEKSSRCRSPLKASATRRKSKKKTDALTGACLRKQSGTGCAPSLRGPEHSRFLAGEPKPHLLKIWKAEIVGQSGGAGEILSADKTGIMVGLRRKCAADSGIAARRRTADGRGGIPGRSSVESGRKI